MPLVNTEKNTTTFVYDNNNNDDDNYNNIKWCMSMMQGYRNSMEDFAFSQSLFDDNKHYIFGIFDGHRGNYAAKFTCDNFIQVFYEQPSIKEYNEQQRTLYTTTTTTTTTDAVPAVQQKRIKKQKLNNDDDDDEHSSKKDKTTGCELLLKRGLEETFCQLDLLLLYKEIEKEEKEFDEEKKKQQQQKQQRSKDDDNDNDDDYYNRNHYSSYYNKTTKTSGNISNDNTQKSGTTAVVVVLTPEWIVCGNVGDSRAILATAITKTTTDNNNKLKKPPLTAKTKEKQQQDHDHDQDDSSDDGNGTSSKVIKSESNNNLIKIKAISNDHKPTLPEETSRIIKAGGSVYFNAVDGELGVSRTIGDFDYKDYNNNNIITTELFSKLNDTKNNNSTEAATTTPSYHDLIKENVHKFKVTPYPEVTITSRSRRNDNNDGDSSALIQHASHILVLASDGVWDVMSNEKIICKIQEYNNNNKNNKIAKTVEDLLDSCIENGSCDNMSIIVVSFS